MGAWMTLLVPKLRPRFHKIKASNYYNVSPRKKSYQIIKSTHYDETKKRAINSQIVKAGPAKDKSQPPTNRLNLYVRFVIESEACPTVAQLTQYLSTFYDDAYTNVTTTAMHNRERSFLLYAKLLGLPKTTFSFANMTIAECILNPFKLSCFFSISIEDSFFNLRDV